jgi:hypothetical protein
MPKNTVNDPITDQELAFAHLILSGTMNDRQAAEAAGLNPDTAAYTKSKPRVHDYMIEHRNAVREKLVALEVEGLRKLNLGRDQILTRLWELANLSHEVTRGVIAGQIKALAMILAIEGLIPGRGPSPSHTRPTAPPVKPQIYNSESRHEEPLQPVVEKSRDTVTGTKTSTTTAQDPRPKPTTDPISERANGMPSPNISCPQRNIANPFIHPEKQNWVPDATALVFDAALDTPNSHRLSFPLMNGTSGRRR